MEAIGCLFVFYDRTVSRAAFIGNMRGDKYFVVEVPYGV